MTRDMTEAQFKKAANAQGFGLGLLGLVDDSGHGWVSYGYIMHKPRGSWKVHRRASLVKAMRLRDDDAKKPRL